MYTMYISQGRAFDNNLFQLILNVTKHDGQQSGIVC